MGSPAIDLVTANVENDTLRSPLGEVKLDGRLRAALDEADRKDTVIIGLRPEHLQDAKLTEHQPGGAVTFTGDVGVLEAMGAEYYAYFDLPDQPSVTDITDAAHDTDSDPVGRRHGTQLIAGLQINSEVREHESITLWFEPEQLLVFDPDSGRRLTAYAA